MYPYFELFGRDLGMYSIMTLCGIFTAGIYSCIMAIRKKYDYADLIIFILIISAGAFIGTHLLYAIVNYQIIIYVFGNIEKIDTLGKALDALKYILGGSVFYGALFGGLLTGYIFIKKNNCYEKYVDIVAVNIPLFHFFGRIGCFLGGCCYGIPSKTGFVYTINPIVEANGITRFPVQLLEALKQGLCFRCSIVLIKNGKYKDKLLYICLLTYATRRFFIEFLRGDSYRGIWLFFSTSQIISILVILFVLIK